MLSPFFCCLLTASAPAAAYLSVRAPVGPAAAAPQPRRFAGPAAAPPRMMAVAALPRLPLPLPRLPSLPRLPLPRLPRFGLASLAAAFSLVDARVFTAAAGGAFAGGLHAISGPDHLSALLPLCVGRRWYSAVYSGAYWGLGHGIGAALVGALAFAVRGALNLDAFSAYMEAIVGVSIVVIGATGVREAREWWQGDPDAAEPAAEAGAAAEGTGVACEAAGVLRLGAPHDTAIVSAETAVLETVGVGIINGVTGSGHLLGVMPALAMPSWLCAGAYLGCFGLGTLLAMAGFTAAVGELSSQMSDRLGDDSMPARIALVSSLVALSVGLAWIGKALLEIGVPNALWRAARGHA